MRDYGKVSPKFWTGDTGKEIRKLGQQTQLIALYLMTCPAASMIGFYYLPLPTLSHETGCPIEGASKILRSLGELEFCHYDEASEHVWVVNMIRYQLGDRLDPKDKRCVMVRKDVETLRKNTLYARFYRTHSEAFQFTDISPFEAPSKPRAGAGERTRKRAGTRTETESLPPSPADAKSVEVSPKASSNGSAGSHAFGSYATAYQHRYGAAPVRNAKTNALFARLAERIGEDAGAVAAFYLGSANAYYLQRGHSPDCLLRDAEKLHTEWVTGNRITATRAQSQDRTASNPFAKLAMEARQREQQGS